MQTTAGAENPLFFLVLALALAVVAVLVLAAPAAGEGTVLVDLGEDLLTQEDSSLTFTPSVSYTGTKGLNYQWDLGDGTSSTATHPIHSYPLAGNYTVSLTVTDTDGVWDSDSIYVEVLNVRPVADAGTSLSVMEGTTVTLDGSNTWDTPSDLPLLTYEWDFGDGTPGTGASPSNKVVSHTYADAGIYIVRLVVRDDDWTSSNHALFSSQLITVEGSASGNGTITFSYSSGSGNGTSPNGTGNETGEPVEYYWDFGDGNYSSGTSVTHTFGEDGVYVVTFIITDAFGAMDVHHIVVTVLNSPPSAEAGPDVAGDEDEVITFTGQGSDVGGGPVSFAWDFGDGHASPGQVVTHAFTTSGTFTVTLTVTDANGLQATDTCSATITNVGPTAAISVGSGSYEGDLISFSGTGTTDTDSDLPLLTYAWGFGDGSTASTRDTTHAYADEGTYTITLTVTDDDGATSVASSTITLGNAAPTATIASVTCAADPILPLDNITFVAQATDAGAADVLTVSWSFGDGNTSTGLSAVHNYSIPGGYTVSLTVTDGDGGVATASTTVTVENATVVADEGKDMVTSASASSFDKPQDKRLLEDMFDDLLDHLSLGEFNKARADIHVLEVQIGIKVLDLALKQELLDLLAHINASLG